MDSYKGSETYYYVATYPEFRDDQVSYDDITAAYSLYFSLQRNDFRIVTVNMRKDFESKNNVIFKENLKENEKRLIKNNNNI